MYAALHAENALDDVTRNVVEGSPQVHLGEWDVVVGEVPAHEREGEFFSLLGDWGIAETTSRTSCQQAEVNTLTNEPIRSRCQRLGRG